MGVTLTERQSVAAMRLALAVVEDKTAPPVLALAAWRFVYRGEAETFLGLIREAAGSMGIAPPPQSD